MRFLFSILAALTLTFSALAQTPKDVTYVFTEASDLNLIGKIHENTPNPYHRVDTVKYKGFTKGENRQVRSAAGLAVLFKTNSTTISVKTTFGWEYQANNTMPLAYRGYDLYIKENGKWIYAASGAPKHGAPAGKNVVLIRNMDGKEKECMLYLPIYSELYSVQIGVQDGSYIESLESPFKHRIGIFGSSFTHGISTSRAGMSYPMQLMRSTGLQFLSLGCSGNCKMQPYFAEVLCDANVDALVFDAFSNPRAQMIKERLFPFIEKIQSAHPDIPLIFQQTIYREKRNFDTKEEAKEKAKQETAAKLMAEACKKYKNVYFIQTNASMPSHETSVDGIHPDDYGYTLWAKSIEKPLLEILKKYGIEGPANPELSPRFKWTEASDLTLCGKLMTDTPNPYHRVDTVKFKGFTKKENFQVRMSSGISVAFKTNSTSIRVLTEYGQASFPTNGNGYSSRGYDLYIKKDGQWVYAESGVADDLNKRFTLIRNMDNSEKECLLYLPLYSEVKSVKIGIDKDADIEALPNPFRHRIGIFGSSFTHGSSTSRSGMTYPAIFSRRTGVQLLSLGCSGNCKLQDYFCDVLCAADVDAFIFDSFSNPSEEQIKERLFPFIEKLQKAHPGKPLIFQATIRRESRNFNLKSEKEEQSRMDLVEKMMKEACNKYPDVHFIHPNATADDNNASVDATHPDNYGYNLWARSIEKPVMKILKKYGIK
jgi:lysophospholipase L1-like esterase